MNLTIRSLICLFALAISSCVPTVSKIYQAPRAVGQVIDLATLRPIQGVNVAHQQNTKKFVVTNFNGEFVLPSISETDFKLLMAGHALNSNLITIYNQDNQIGLIAQSTLESRVEETINLETIVFDSEPKIIASAVKPSYQPHSLLRTYFMPQGILASCDSDLARAALSALNTSRKLAEKASNRIELSTSEAKRLRSLTFVNYERTAKLWYELKLTCDRKPENYKKIDSVFASIQEESSFIVF